FADCHSLRDREAPATQIDKPPEPRSTSVFSNHTPPKDLKRTSVRGAAVTGASQACKSALRLGSTAILAQLLTPEDYGVVAMTASSYMIRTTWPITSSPRWTTKTVGPASVVFRHAVVVRAAFWKRLCGRSDLPWHLLLIEIAATSSAHGPYGSPTAGRDNTRTPAPTRSRSSLLPNLPLPRSPCQPDAPPSHSPR
ncbi:MAG TPA: hypothetical protein VL069_05905, partial [Opitutus sp.]|nr:hypothetical protein [Opitutus sp.]